MELNETVYLINVLHDMVHRLQFINRELEYLIRRN